ncbi:hypothetical protein DVA44_07485 [Leclercia sp. W17]|nr:hypothetical protein DVA44_07485 [Leclercia sp. W17]
MRLAPAFRKRFGDFQPDQAAAVRPLLFCYFFIAVFLFCRPGKAKPPPGGGLLLLLHLKQLFWRDRRITLGIGRDFRHCRDWHQRA